VLRSGLGREADKDISAVRGASGLIPIRDWLSGFGVFNLVLGVVNSGVSVTNIGRDLVDLGVLVASTGLAFDALGVPGGSNLGRGPKVVGVLVANFGRATDLCGINPLNRM